MGTGIALPFALAVVLALVGGCRFDFEERSRAPDAGPDTSLLLDAAMDALPDASPGTDAAFDTAVADTAPLAPFDIEGHWARAPGSVDFGDVYFVYVAGHFRGVYEHDDGRLIGEFAGNTLTGWWSQTPGRAPPADAGEFRFAVSEDGSGLHIIGEWDGSGRTFRDWNFDYVGPSIPASVMTEFANDADFVDGR